MGPRNMFHPVWYRLNFSLTVVTQFREKQSNRCNSAPYFYAYYLSSQVEVVSS